MISGLYDRELEFGEILKAAWQTYSRNFFYIFLFCFLVGCVLRGVDYLIFISLSYSPQDPALAGHSKILFSGFFGFVFSLVVLSIVKSEQKNETVCWSSIFYTVRHFFWAAFLVYFLVQLISTLTWMPGVLLRFNNITDSVSTFVQLPLFIISFMLTVYFTFACEALVLREEYAASALVYSYRTVKGRWWRILGIIILLGMMVGIPVMILAFVVRSAVQVSMSAGLYLLFPVTMVFNAYFSVFFAILFLNIDREGLKGKVEELRHPVDPVNPV